MNHLGGLVVYGGEVGGFRGTCLVERMCTQGATRVCHSGLKRLLCFRVLPVQRYDTMGSVLIEYDVRVQP
jgi:hypothetical protein